MWKWERSTGRNAWAVIEGANAAGYTPVAADTNAFLRVTAAYEDEHGTGKSVSEVVPNIVTGPLLSSLRVTTEAADAASAQAMYPAFDPQTLHYGIGCNASDTMTVTLTAPDDARVAVDGVQADSGTATSVPVSEYDDVSINVTDASGAGTTYRVHCMVDVLFAITTVTYPEAAGTIEDLIVFAHGQHFMAVDHNGVPRFRRLVPGLSGFATRFHRIGAEGAYRYAYAVGGERDSLYTILDENLEPIDESVRTVAPLVKINTHDFQVLDNGNYLLMAYEPATRDFTDIDLPYREGTALSALSALSAVAVQDSAIQIVTPTGEAVLTWNSWDHMAIEDCVQHRFPVRLAAHTGTGPLRDNDGDYAHVNGLHSIDGRTVVASFRGCARVLAIDVDSGAVVWRLGLSNLSDEEWAARGIGPPPLDFINDPLGQNCDQHTSRFFPNGNVFMYDNGVECAIDPETFEKLGRRGSEYSRAVEYALDLENHEAVFVRDHSLRNEKKYVGNVTGNVDYLDNGDWLVSWGRLRSLAQTDRQFPDNEAATLVDPDTGEEKLAIRFKKLEKLPGETRLPRISATALPTEALAPQPIPLIAQLPASTYTSVFHLGDSDEPQVVVAFGRPVADFDPASPSFNVAGAAVASVSAHVMAGEAANAYLVTLTPAGAGAITFSLVADQPCADGGICTADGTTLSEVPSPLVIGPPVTATFDREAHSVREGNDVTIQVRLSTAHQGVRSVTVPITVGGGTASIEDITAADGVTFEAGETQRNLLVEALDDDLVEGSETIELSFGALPHGVVAGATAAATVTLTDADSADIAFSVDSSEVAEGGSTAFTLAITNGVTFERNQTLSLTVGGTATHGDDFRILDAYNQALSPPYVLTFPAG